MGTSTIKRADSILDTLQFHHIGVACSNIQRELQSYQLLGYISSGEDLFEDLQQGVRGLFLTMKGAPTLELLENLQGSSTLDAWIKRGQKLYHIAYCVKDIEGVLSALLADRAKMVSPLKESTYFKKQICFLMLPNRQLVELIEE